MNLQNEIIKSSRKFSRPAKLASRPTRWVGIALYLGVVLVNSYYVVAGICRPENLGLSLGLLIFYMVALWGIDVYEERRYGLNPPLVAGLSLIALRLGILQLIPFVDCTGFHRFLYMVPPFLAYLYFGRKSGFVVAAISYIFFMIDFYRAIYNDIDSRIVTHLAVITNELFIAYSFILLLGMIFVLLMAEVLRYEKSSRLEAEALYIELEQSQKQVAELAMVAERNRIARDIHDSLGHHLTAVSIQLEKAKAFQKIDAFEAGKALDSAKRSTTEALQDVRKSVGSLREPVSRSGSRSGSPLGLHSGVGLHSEAGLQTGLNLTAQGSSAHATEAEVTQDFKLADSLDELIKGYKEVKVDYTLSGNESAFTQPVLMALYRIVQEGLTNIRKHARATEVKVDVRLEDSAKLQLEDNGVGFNVSEKPEQHFGLQGLQERVELVGGQLTIASELGKGTRIAVSIPKQGLKASTG